MAALQIHQAHMYKQSRLQDNVALADGGKGRETCNRSERQNDRQKMETAQKEAEHVFQRVPPGKRKGVWTLEMLPNLMLYKFTKHCPNLVVMFGNHPNETVYPMMHFQDDPKITTWQ